MDPNTQDSHQTPQDDITLHGYQDDLDTSDTATDAIIDEETDDPTETLKVDPQAFKDEQDKYDFEADGVSSDDMNAEDAV